MLSREFRSSQPEQSASVSREIPVGMQLAGLAAFLLWRGYYFFAVVVIPALGWR
jgi:hypothetical protein